MSVAILLPLAKQHYMKKITLLLAVLLVGLIGFSQEKTPVDSAKTAKHKQVQNPAAWACPACYKITKEGGTCPDDKTAKIQLGTYYCQHCVKATGDKPGICPTCKGATTQMTRKLCKEHTGNVKKTA